MEKQELIGIKVYLDANLIFDQSKIDNITQEEVEALAILPKPPRVNFYVSEKVKKEIKELGNPKKRNYLIFLYNLIQEIPEENIIQGAPAMFGSTMFGSTMFGGGRKIEDPLFIKLKQIFDKDDAELIFQAEKNDLDYFLTLDKRTILNRLHGKEDQLKETGLKIRIVSPSQLVKELDLNKTNIYE